MKKLLKGLAIVFTLFVVTVAAGLFYANKKLNSDKIREIAIEHISGALPGAHVELGKIDYSLGLTIVVDLNDLNLSLKKHKQSLLKIKKAQAHIPLIPFVLGLSKINLNIDSPNLNYEEIEGKSNWSLALLRSSLNSNQNKEKLNSEISLSEEEQLVRELGPFAAFLVDVSISNAFVTYKTDTHKTNLVLDKIKINDLGFSRSASFEVMTALSRENQYSLNAKIIGELDVSHFLKNGDINIIVNNQFNNIKIMPYGSLPDLSGEAKIKFHRDGKADLNVKGNFAEEGHFSSNIIIETNKISFLNIESSFNIVSFLSGLNLQNKVEGLQFEKSILKIDGSLIVNKGNILPDLIGEIGPSIVFSKKEIRTRSGLNFVLKKNILEAKVKTFLYDGLIESDIRMPFSEKELNLKNLKPLNVKMEVQGIKFNERIRISSSSDKLNQSENNAEKSQEIIFLPPPMLLSVNFKDCLIDQAPLNGDLEMAILPKSAKLSKLNLFLSGGQVTGSGFAQIGNEIKGDFSIQFDKLDISKFSNVFVQSYFRKAEGILSGNAEGMYQINNRPTYKMNLNLEGYKLGAENINTRKIVNEFSKNNPLIATIIKEEIVNDVGANIESFKVKTSLNQENINIKKIEILLDKKIGQLSGTGKISMEAGKSHLNLIYKDFSGKVSKILKKEFNLSALPLYFEGKGFELRPNYEYTAKELGKRALAKKGKKAIKKEINKALKGKTKEAANKLLEEIFQ